MPSYKHKPGKCGTTTRPSIRHIINHDIDSDSASLSVIHDSGELVISEPDESPCISDEIAATFKETIPEFEARRQANLLLLDCPEKQISDEEKMQYLLRVFPTKSWPILCRYW